MDTNGLIQLCADNNLKVLFTDKSPDKMEYSRNYISIILIDKHTNQKNLNMPIKDSDTNIQYYYVKGFKRELIKFVQIISKFEEYIDLIDIAFSKQITYLGKELHKLDLLCSPSKSTRMDIMFDLNFNIISSIESRFNSSGTSVFITTLLTNPTYYRKGFALILVKNLMDSYIHNNPNIVNFNTGIMVWNTPSYDLFKKFGFVASQQLGTFANDLIKKGLAYHKQDKLKPIKIQLDDSTTIDCDESCYYIMDYNMPA
jgi:hypothetical protein